VKKIFVSVFLFIMIVSFANAQSSFNIIPQPNSIQTFDGSFKISKNTFAISLDIELYDEQYFIYELKKRYGIKIVHGVSYNLNKPSIIRLTMDTANHLMNGGYVLLATKGMISISGSGKDGIFNGIQTLLQLIAKESDSILSVPYCMITDEPRFEWRGMHLDVSRHFFSKEEVKKYIDLLAYHKMNVFHWHLTDDQGWRIEIKKYPLLTSIGSKRKETMVDKNFNPYMGDGKPYGGFYTQKDIQEIVSYADNRHITVVPEIEMPGHAQAAIAAYPQYSCSGLPSDVLTKWGVSENVFCTKDSTLQFIKDVLKEVMEMFPSQYIHIGGDEVPKAAWKNCAVCQSNIKKYGLKDEHELQSWFIKQIDNFVTSNGKEIIGWDEILEGGLAPNAAVMSWRGTDGGIAAARMKHKVVMCPGSHCYFDHYQGSPLTQPLAIGGYTTVQKVYSYEPIPDSLNADEQKYIMGAQANLWTEYIADYNKLTFMALPRMSAIAEVLWTKKENKNFNLFQNRLLHQFKKWDNQNINYSKALLDIDASLQPFGDNKSVEITLHPPFANGYIKYKTCDSCGWNNYASPIIVNKNSTIEAYYQNAELNIKSELWKQKITAHKALAKTIVLTTQPDKRYNNGGAFTLIDGIKGITPWYSKEWLGFSGVDCEALIDLGEEKPIGKIKIGLLQDDASWIHLPDSVGISYSLDNAEFAPYYNSHLLINDNRAKLQRQEWSFIPAIPQNELFLTETNAAKIKVVGVTARYIKVMIHCKKSIAAGKPGAGEKAWLFVDEIEVR
jgi:hexosaminidase